MPYPTPAPSTPPITAPAARFFLLMIAPRTAPPAPPITAPFVDLLQPLSLAVSAGCVAGAEAVPADSDVPEPCPLVPEEAVVAGPSSFVDGVAGAGEDDLFAVVLCAVVCCGTRTSRMMVTVFAGAAAGCWACWVCCASLAAANSFCAFHCWNCARPVVSAVAVEVCVDWIVRVSVSAGLLLQATARTAMDKMGRYFFMLVGFTFLQFRHCIHTDPKSTPMFYSFLLKRV
jgi:hypothetical protein